MRAGRLDRIITIERGCAFDADAYGTPQVSFLPLATVRAQIVQATTEEFMRAFGASSETAIVFRTRYLDGVTLADRVIHNGVVHDIKELKEIGRRRGLEIRTVSTGEPAPEEAES